MEPEDPFRNLLCNEQFSSSSDDEDELPLRKKLKTNSVPDENSTQEDNKTCSEQYTQETVLTGASRDTAEVWETAAETNKQQDHCTVSIATDDNSNNSHVIGQNTPELQTNINDSVSDDTNINSTGNLDTVQPNTRYVMPPDLLYRSSISEVTMTQNISDSVDEAGNKHDTPKRTNDVATTIEQIRQDFIRSWERILAADDLIPEAELATLNSSTPDKICEYLSKLAATNARNENLKDLVPKVCDEIHNLQQRDERVDRFQSCEPEPEPTPISDFLTDPLDVLEPDHENSLANNEFNFNIQHWQRFQQPFSLPEQLPNFDELFTNSRISIPDDARDDNAVDYQPLTDVPSELVHIYSTIVREATGNQFGQSTSKQVHSEDPYLSHFVNSDSNARQSNYDADLYRSLLGITSPFEQNVNTNNEELATPVFTHSSPDYSLNRPVATECVPTQIFSNPFVSNPVELESNIVKSDFIIPDLDPIPSDLKTNSAELQTNPSKMTPNPTELHTTPVDIATNPCQMATNPVELASSPVTFNSISNQENSGASIPSGSNAPDGHAQFVVVPSNNNFKPLKIFVANPSDAEDEHNAPTVSTVESTGDDITDSATTEVTNDEEEINDAQQENDLAMQEMDHFESELSTIETEISVIMEEADRFEQQAARFEETADEFHEVQNFFQQISEIFEYAAVSLQEAVDTFESSPIEEAADVVDALDPLQEGIPIEDDNGPDQEVPNIEYNDN